MAGVFVVFEGGDGVGKSTQAALLADWARAQGREVLVTLEPGGSPIGEGDRAVALGEPLAVGGEDQGHVRVAGHGEAEAVGQEDLARGGRQ